MAQEIDFEPAHLSGSRSVVDRQAFAAIPKLRASLKRLVGALGAAALISCVSAVPTPTAAPTALPPTSTVAPSPTAAPPSPTALPAAPSATAVPATPVPAAPTATAVAAKPTSAATVAAVGTRAAELRIGGQPVRDLAATPDGRVVFALAGGELYRQEGGEWRATGGRPPAGRLLTLDADRLAVGEMPGCARGGGSPLRWSGSGGVGWRDATGPVDGPLHATPWLARGGELYALACEGTFVSTDGGRSFRRVAGLATPNFDPFDLAISPDGAFAYLAGNSEGGSLQVVRAERRGADWTGQTRIDTGWARGALAAGPGGRVVLATALAVKLSDDRGESWRSISRGLEAELLSTDPSKGVLPEADQRKLQSGYGVNDLLLLGDTLYAATQHGVYARRGDEAWTRQTTVKTLRLFAAGSTPYVVTDAGVAPLTSS